MRKLGPVGIAAILCLVFVAALAATFFVVTSGGSNSGATAATQGAQSLQQPGTHATGEVLACPGGGEAETSFSQVGNEFRIVGRLASIDPSQLLVKGPQQYVKLVVAPNARIDSSLRGGQIIKAAGNFDQSGTAQATDVQLACSAAAVVGQVTTAPTQAPAPTQAIVLAPAPTARPTASPSTHITVRGPTIPVIVSTPRPTRSPENAHPASDDSHGKPKKPKHGDD
ncbi:MAG: hypothetical protein ABI559_09835 [Chloroflexota bacterium]